MPSHRYPFFTSARGRLLSFNLLMVAVTLMVAERSAAGVSPCQPATRTGAAELTMGSTPQVEPGRDKPTVVALREIAAGKVGLEVLNRPQS